MLEDCKNWSQLLDKEKFWIAKLLKDDHPLLNIYEAEDIFSHREKIKELKSELKKKEDLLRIKIEKFAPKMFGKEVYYQRKKRKLSRNEFAKIAGVGKTVVYDIEHGKQTCRTETILRIAKALNIRLFFLVQKQL